MRRTKEEMKLVGANDTLSTGKNIGYVRSAEHGAGGDKT